MENKGEHLKMLYVICFEWNKQIIYDVTLRAQFISRGLDQEAGVIT